jgi:hypothetical protein
MICYGTLTWYLIVSYKLLQLQKLCW